MPGVREGRAARIRSITVRDGGFQLDATGNNPFRLMKGFKAHDAFSAMKLSPVVADADTPPGAILDPRFFHGR